MCSLIDQDIALALHADTPVGIPSPLLEAWTAVSRIEVTLTSETCLP